MNQEFKSKIQSHKGAEAGSLSARCPSNIALIKYWGKHGEQLPMNPSLSFTLNESYTETTLKYSPKTSEEFSVKVFLDGEEEESFLPKIIQFFNRIEVYLPFLRDFSFEVHTRNSFPHSSGIASSASGMGALALCLTELENRLGGELNEKEQLRKSSFLARLGSGSACRSIYPGITVWGKTDAVEGSSDLFAIPYPYEVHPIFEDFRDTILLIDEGQKQVSSTVGHGLMHNHPYAEARFEDARRNLEELIPVLAEGDLEKFGNIVEREALSLHAMMLTSNPYFILMKAGTLKAINKIWEFREETKLPLYFTLDAGANLHLLYPAEASEKTDAFIEKELMQFTPGGKAIRDFTD